jgi:hypothetical protein
MFGETVFTLSDQFATKHDVKQPGVIEVIKIIQLAPRIIFAECAAFFYCSVGIPSAWAADGRPPVPEYLAVLASVRARRRSLAMTLPGWMVQAATLQHRCGRLRKYWHQNVEIATPVISSPRRQLFRKENSRAMVFADGLPL